MTHSHAHNRDHHAHHHQHNDGKALGIGIALNAAFICLEAGYGLWSHSLALLADAGHNIVDMLGLMLVWLTTTLTRRLPSPRFTYGLGGSTILAALANALLILLAVGAIAWEAIVRLQAPPIVTGAGIMALAAIGIVINGATAWMLRPRGSSDLNMKGAYLHMLADAMISAGVVVAGGLIIVTGSYWIDPLTSLIVIAFILYSTWDLLKEALQMMLGAVPSGIDRHAVADFLTNLPGVTGIHDLHIWPLSTRETALTAHLIMPGGHPGDQAIQSFAHDLLHRFGIGHSTLQIETNGTYCALAPDEVV